MPLKNGHWRMWGGKVYELKLLLLKALAKQDTQDKRRRVGNRPRNVASVANSCMHRPWSRYKQAADLSILTRRLGIQD